MYIICFSIDSVWIGLNDRRLENTFEWVSGDVSAYRNWVTGNPKVPGSAGEDEDCVALHDQMVDESCAHLKESICEITPGKNIIEENNRVLVFSTNRL